VKIYKIETNYRSTPDILNVANAAIAGNSQQFTKVLESARKGGMRPAVVACGDSSEQARFVAQRVLQLREEGLDLNKAAVLYRSHFHALELQLELARRNIPFSITSGIRFFEQAHIKDVIAHLKLVINPQDEISFKRLVQLLPGIGAKGAAKLWERLRDEGSERAADKSPVEEGSETPNSKLQTSPEQREARDERGSNTSAPGLDSEGFERANSEIPNPGATGQGERPHVAVALQRIAGHVPKKTAVAWAQFVATISQLEVVDIREKPADMLRLVLEAGYEDYLRENYDNYKSRVEELQQLAVFAQQFMGTEEFLTQLALLSNLEAEDERPADRDEEQIRLSTIHQAKGLEFDVVFVIMLCDGLFPSARSSETLEGEEEERRLMYVAITRARNELYLSYPLVHPRAGGTDGTMQLRSRFLEEIPADLVEEWNLRTY